MEKSEKEISPVVVTILKVVAYAIGLILAGIGTTASANALGLI